MKSPIQTRKFDAGMLSLCVSTDFMSHAQCWAGVHVNCVEGLYFSCIFFSVQCLDFFQFHACWDPCSLLFSPGFCNFTANVLIRMLGSGPKVAYWEEKNKRRAFPRLERKFLRILNTVFMWRVFVLLRTTVAVARTRRLTIVTLPGLMSAPSCGHVPRSACAPRVRWSVSPGAGRTVASDRSG